ncbi:MAG: TIGR00266 family protein [Pirellulales bacterium]|nr:TIGR00266 family protein [Pirellulales bacterium]
MEFRCHACGTLLRVPSGTSGERGQCPSCMTEVQIPSADERGQEVIMEPLAPANQSSGPPQISDEIDYEIFGEEMQFVEITLDPGEMVVAEAGAMMFMSPAIEMQTVFGDPSQPQTGFFGKLMTAGKRVMTGESLFMTTFTNAGSRREIVAFASPYPGKLLPMHLNEFNGELICQKDSFVCAARGTQVGIAFQKKLGAGFFGGEGFIMQRLIGDGVAIVHAGGTLIRKQLEAEQVLKVDTGCLVAMTTSVTYDVQFVGGVRNTLFGGEGLFFVKLTGPGDVWLQSLPFSRLAGRIQSDSGGKGEGSILGGIGRVLDGDNG